MTRHPVAIIVALTCLAPRAGIAQLAAPGGAEIPATGSFLDRHFALDGYLRVRFDVLDRLDLQAGPTPSTGLPYFPRPASGTGDTFTSANMRLRFEPTIRVGWGVAVHAQIDLLDNLVLGSTPEGLPASVAAPMSGASASQVPPEAGKSSDRASVRVKRAWADLVLPFGILSAGRMGALIDWGTGFFINSGSGLDADLGDVGDRISFVMPISNLLVGFAFDFGASGPTSASLRPDGQPFDLDRRDDVRSWALMVTNYQMPNVVERYRRAGRPLFQFGALASLRTQDVDVPAYYLTGDLDRHWNGQDYVNRGLLAFAGDLWLGLRHRGWTIDLEVAGLYSRIENASLLPNTEFLQPITARQLGGVARVLHDWPRLQLGLELGLASGDAAPGFGVRPPLTQYSSQPGDLDGPQLKLPGDTTVNNFRFNPDYHIDEILWRRIIGAVTDAVYLRPSVAWRPARGLSLTAALIASFAMEKDTPPGGERPLGVEVDLGVRYRIERACLISATYGVLAPLGGLRNARLGIDASPAQVFHLLLAYTL